jgi:hypothetical protein
LIYTPHPSNDVNALRRAPFFADSAVVVYDDTILTWFIADICISLWSSGLFEANYFGARVLTPLEAGDGMYPAELLDVLGRRWSESDDDPLVGFEDWLFGQLPTSPSDLRERARRRLALLGDLVLDVGATRVP